MKRLTLSFLAAGLAVWAMARPAQAVLCSSCAYITANNNIYAWEPISNKMILVTSIPSGAMDSLVFDTNRNIIAGAGRDVYRYNSTTQVMSKLVANVGGAGAPNPDLGDFAMEPNGESVLVAGRADHSIYRINLNTGDSTVFFHQSDRNPDGIIYDNTGKLFAAFNRDIVAQLDPTTGTVLKQISGVNGADGLTFSTTTLKIYAGVYTGNNTGGFYTLPTDLSSKAFTPINGRDIDGVGTSDHFLYLISYDDAAIKYDLTTGQVVATGQRLAGMDDIAPLSGFGSLTPDPAPVLNSLSPSSTAAGSPAFTLTLNGSNFMNGALAMWNGVSRPTTFVNATTLTAQISAADVSTAGTVNVEVKNRDNQIPNTLPFTITSAGTPAPILSSLTPSTTAAGSPLFTLTLSGSNFVIGSSVKWNGSPRPTLFVNAATLTAQISAADVAIPGTVAVGVTNPDTQNSNTLPFTIAAGVPATLTRIQLTPQNPSTPLHGTIQFSAQGFDQNDNPMTGLTFTWTTANPTNTIDATGLFVANITGNDTVRVMSGSVQATTNVTVTAPVLTTIVVTPLAAYRHPGQIVAFTAQAYDQNNQPYSVPSFNWSLPQNQSGATIDANGLYTAGNASLPATDRVTATVNNVIGRAEVVVDNPGGNLTIHSVTATPNPVFGVSTQLHVDATGPAGETLSYLWSRVSGPAAVVFGAPSAADSVATFSTPGVYVLQVRVNSSGGLTLTGGVTVTVVRTVSRVTVDPGHAAVQVGQTFAFNKHVFDQFGVEMPAESVTWSTSDGSISAAGAFYSNSTFRLVTITATSVTRPTIKGDATLEVQQAIAGDFDISEAYAYPVPWKTTMPVPFITFAKLKAGTHVRIFTSAGHIVRTITSDNGEDKQWYIDNNAGERVASGVYFYIIDNDTSGQRIKGKLVVIK